MAGDWNFVVNKDDRWSKQNGSWTGGTDAAEAREFANNFCRPRNFTEWLQPVLTHECGKARSKLDRVYSNHSISDQLDRAYGCVALPKVPCSAHRPVAFSRKAPELDDIITFMAQVYIRSTSHAETTILALDDVQWMDNSS